MSKRFAGWLGLSLLTIVLDQWSKLAIVARFAENEYLPLTDFFNLTLRYNPGAAFSFLAGHDGWQRWFFTVLAVGVSAYLIKLIRQHQSEILQPASFALIVGGALGNVIDRFHYGRVVDFLDVHIGDLHWPAFNIADSAICLGVTLMIIAEIRRSLATRNTGTRPK